MTHKNDRTKERLELTSCPWQFTCGCEAVIEADTKEHLDQRVRDHLLACGGGGGRKLPARGR